MNRSIKKAVYPSLKENKANRVVAVTGNRDVVILLYKPCVNIVSDWDLSPASLLTTSPLSTDRKKYIEGNNKP